MSLTVGDPMLGKTIAERYRLISRLGSGGMASVYLARHVLIERLSAIKIVHPELASDPAYKHRFLREARAVNRINHPNIVEINDYGEADGLVYLVMEYVPGESLMKLLERGPLGWQRAAAIGLQIASALGRAHQMGVIHRDLKPANLLLVPRRDAVDLVKLTDFGVAKVLDATTLTTSDVALGTPGYVAPEYRDYGSVDARSDLFSLGVVLYETAAGVRPFDPTYQANCVSSALPPVERLSRRMPDVPPLFEEVVMTLLAADPDDRPRDGFEAFDLLRRVVEQKAMLDPAVSSAASAASERSPRPSIPRRRPGPHLTTVSFDRIGPLCAAALSRVEARAQAWSLGSASTAVPPDTLAAIADAQKLVKNVEAIAALVASDSEALEIADARGRALRSGLGTELDVVAREQSKTLGWAGTIAERTYAVQSARVSGEHSVNLVEAMVWEQAALEQEEDRARETAAELLAHMARLKTELGRHNELLERETMTITARLEGRIAALRSIALEGSMAVEVAAKLLGLDPEGVWGETSSAR